MTKLPVLIHYDKVTALFFAYDFYGRLITKQKYKEVIDATLPSCGMYEVSPNSHIAMVIRDRLRIRLGLV